MTRCDLVAIAYLRGARPWGAGRNSSWARPPGRTWFDSQGGVAASC